MFATDRDLLILEPNLFREVFTEGQRLVRGDGSIVGTTLALDFFQVSFEDAGITSGHIATVGDVSYEVIDRLSSAEVKVSRLRADETDAAIPPSPVESAPVSVISFAPQLRIIHDQLLCMLGIDPGGEETIMNPAEFRRVEALGALSLIFHAAGFNLPRDSPMNQRADHYRARYRNALQLLVAKLDLNNDGIHDATRRPNVHHLLRA